MVLPVGSPIIVSMRGGEGAVNIKMRGIWNHAWDYAHGCGFL